MLKALERFGEQLEVLYRSLPTLCEQFAPDWEGDTAERASEVFGQYDAVKKKCFAKLQAVEKRLRHALKTAEEIDQLFEKKGGE